jgi:hypothetical protein
MNWTKMNVVSFILCFLILFVGIFHIGLPLYADVILSILLAFLLKSWVSSIITISFLLFGIFLINFIFEGEVDYRAHEMLSTHESHYEKSVVLEFTQPYGDLFAIGGNSDALNSIIEPRGIKFVTDSEGHRNRTFHSDPAYILVGDSFIVGNGTTQSDILSEKLSVLLDSNVYSLSYPGDPIAYEAKTSEYDSVLSGKQNVLLFYFEGNDFQLGRNATESYSTFKAVKEYILYLENLKSRYFKAVYPRWFKFSKVVNRQGRLSYVFINNLIFGDDTILKENQVIIEEIEGQKVGFLKKYNDVSTYMSNDVSTYIWNEERVLDRIKYVFFIPTKHRVYHTLESNIPLQVLREDYKKLNVPVIDLTPILKLEAKRKLESGEFVYWRDDTHWNGSGISAAAGHIADLIQASIEN